MMYFDNSATSPIDPEVLDAMLPYLKEEYGNPSSKYYCKGRNAQNAVEEARDNVSRLINCKPGEIVFTAGSTESTNFIIKGTMDYQRYYANRGNHIVTTLAEHKATLNVCKFLNGEIYSNSDPKMKLFGKRPNINRGYEASFVGVDKYGRLNLNSFEEAIKDTTVMASVIYVNNEVGTINDIASCSRICKKYDIALHTDITQALGKIEIDSESLGVDFMSFSAHKIYGPKGIGAAFLKGDDYGIKPITALIHGGEQEYGFRAGTLAVHDIVGFGKAAEIARKDMAENNKKLFELDSYLVSKLSHYPEITLLNPSQERIHGIVSIMINKTDFNNERFIKRMSDEIALSTGSACSAGQPSHVIYSMGLLDKINKVIRLSLSKYLEKVDVDKLIGLLIKNI